MTGQTQTRRLPDGGLVDRSTPVGITVDGQPVTALAGDTVASALLAAGQVRVGNSIYRDRPRGILTAGVDEPNAFVLVKGAHDESMLPATTLQVEPGMDLTLLTGLGVLDQRKDPAEYDEMNVHCDVAVIGAGPAGLAAALEASATGARVVLLEQDHELGGRLLDDPTQDVEGRPAAQWVAESGATLAAATETTVLTRTTVLGSYDSNYLVAVERRGRQFASPEEAVPGVSRQRVWHITAGRVVLATGALERQLVFPDNDVPGVMLASAVASYLGRYAVLPGHEVVVATTNDSAYAVATALREAGADVRVLDAREGSLPSAARDAATAAGLEVRTATTVVGVEGTTAVSGVHAATIDGDGNVVGEPELLPADLLAVSGGWNPTVHLHSQRQGRVSWDDSLVAFVPSGPVHDQLVAGAVAGTWSSAGAVAEGRSAGRGESPTTTAAERHTQAGVTRALWSVDTAEGEEAGTRSFVDPQRDQTVADVLCATGAGMRNVEHVKRYTSVGTGVDQGKIGGVSTIGVLTSVLTGADGDCDQPLTPGDIGTTTFRPPYTPVAFAALAGRRRGDLFDAARVSAAHPWHVEHGAVFEDVGQWKRPRYYPLAGEDMDAAVARECRAAREGVAMMDASTLGKIEIRGADAPEFLNRVYTNAFAKLPVGKARYGLMCTADGMVFDDGVSVRLEEDRFLMTTTTGGAAKVLDWLEEWSQTEWPELDVTMTSVTEQWATTAVVGPRSRDVIARLAPDVDVSKEAFGFMEARDTVLASGIPARICRITFSGELAFEVNVPTWFGLKVWEDIVAAGAELGITPYGTETMHVLRAEKAYPIVGQDTDGTVTPQDLGMDWIVSKKKKDFIGKRSYSRSSHAEAGRKQLVSVLPVDPTLRLPEGTQLVEADALGGWSGEGLPEQPVPLTGHVTSSYHSQALGRSFALALVNDGRDRFGTTLLASFEGRLEPVLVDEPVLYDKEGARRDG